MPSSSWARNFSILLNAWCSCTQRKRVGQRTKAIKNPAKFSVNISTCMLVSIRISTPTSLQEPDRQCTYQWLVAFQEDAGSGDDLAHVHKYSQLHPKDEDLILPVVPLPS